MPTRDETPGATRLLPSQPGDPRAAPSGAELSPAAGANDALLNALRERHGHGPLAEMLYAAELKSRQTLAEERQRLRARLEVLRAAKDLRSREAEALLVPLHEAMDAARAAWEVACAAYERQRLQNQSACAPLDNQIGEILTEMHRSPFVDRVRNWTVPPWYQDRMPEIPPLGHGPYGKPKDD